jgi:ABC-2 type transport system ATP-binding protein
MIPIAYAQSTAGNSFFMNVTYPSGPKPRNAELSPDLRVDQDRLPKNAVEICGLSKTYEGDAKSPPKTALKDVNLTVPRGAFFGILGPNGAGKSTLINILAGLTTKTAGSVHIWDYNIDTNRRNAKTAIGVVPQELNLDPFFTPRELLEFQAGLYGIGPKDRRTDEILEIVGLADKANAYSRSLSGGMRRRLLIAKAILHRPPVVVLDEPTAGVDVELRQQLWAYIKELNEAGTTILLTTHYLEEAEQLCDTIAIIDEGDVIACEQTAQLLQRIDTREMIATVSQDLETVPVALQKFDVTLSPPRCLRFRFKRSETQIGEIITAIQNAGLMIADLSISEGKLEDVFMELTGARPKPPPCDDVP